MIKKYPVLAGGALTALDEIPLEIQQEVLEQDYLYKKDNPEGLVDPNKKKAALNALDLVTYLIKIANESKRFTYSGI